MSDKVFEAYDEQLGVRKRRGNGDDCCVRFMRDCFIRDVHFSFSERTGKKSTVVFFEDGSKTIAVPSDGEPFDPETGIEQCILKRVFGSRSQLKKVFKKYIPEYKAKEKAAHRKAPVADSPEVSKKLMDSIWMKEEEGRPWD